MSDSGIQSDVEKILRANYGHSAVTLDASLEKDLGMDSLDVIEFVIACENETGIYVHDFEPCTVGGNDR
jgi:acyl carrier protein